MTVDIRFFLRCDRLFIGLFTITFFTQSLHHGLKKRMKLTIKYPPRIRPMKSILSKNLTKARVDQHNTAGYLGIRKFHSLLIISLLSPADTVLILFELLFSMGASVLYARAIADYDGDKAKKIEGMTIIMTISVRFRTSHSGPHARYSRSVLLTRSLYCLIPVSSFSSNSGSFHITVWYLHLS